MSVISGNDGKLNAVYEVLYDGDDDAFNSEFPCWFCGVL